MQRSHPHRSRNILFIGMPGAGKTTLGRVYAFLTGREFIDFDVLLEKQSGKTIREIFDTEGEPGFRAREQRTLQKLAHKRGAVIAMGGGTLCNPPNMRFARTLGLLIQLKASNETIGKRVFAEKQKRPLFATTQSEEAAAQKASELLSLRSEFYDCSDFEINTDHASIDCLVLQLMQIERKAHTILQSRTLPKILMSDLSKPTMTAQQILPPDSSASADDHPIEEKKLAGISLLPSLETSLSVQSAGPREPRETYQDLVWKDSLTENTFQKREKKEFSQLSTQENSGANKKKRRKKKKREGEQGEALQQTLSAENKPNSPTHDSARTLRPSGDRRPQHNPDKPPHRSGQRASNGT